ncbi:MAG: glycosyl transferase family 2 [Candidatus Marinimicrobia bacterium]|nr:glycosyl transferase family 2 [Candidatus Neomarinimicrobiota bacterium]|tara:strand:- start:1308 stop:2399 length:1092 start_codon:yes stop_codon:yes gene_type:complete
MIENKTIAVVIPCFNEDSQIGKVIEHMPSFVDRIVIVDDGSTDNTIKVIKSYIKNDQVRSKVKISRKKVEATPFNLAEIMLEERNVKEITKFPEFKFFNDNNFDRIVLIQKQMNTGNGDAISVGLKWCKDNCIDATTIMDGDGQMDPNELKKIIHPILNENIDYVKGNRLKYPGAWIIIPKVRFIGNAILSILTKIASGFWRVSDTQTGYVAFSSKALNSITLYSIYKKYGWPNDILIKINIAMCTIKEVTIKPVYNAGEQSKMKILNVIFPISWLLIKGFFKRIFLRYLIKDFHPLFILYNMSILLLIIWIPYLYKICRALVLGLNLSFEPLFAFSFLGVFGFQSLLFAMWMDIQDNDRLHN